MIKVNPAEIVEALWPTFALFGAILVAIGSAKSSAKAIRLCVMAISLALLLRYAFWRVTCTLPRMGFTLDFVCGVIFLLIEAAGLVAAVLSLVFLSRSRNRSVGRGRQSGLVRSAAQKAVG